MTRIIGLDLATNTGFAIGELGGVPRFGALVLPSTGEDIGRFLAEFEDWMLPVLGREQPGNVFFEVPILSERTMTARKLMGLAGEVERICYRRELDCAEVSITSAKKFLAGHGYADKAMMVDAALRRGWRIADCVGCGGAGERRGRPCGACEGTGKDHNQADAGAIWLYGCATLEPKLITPAAAVELPDRIKRAREEKRVKRAAAAAKKAEAKGKGRRR